MIGSPSDLSDELSSDVASSLSWTLAGFGDEQLDRFAGILSEPSATVAALVRDGYTGFGSLEPHLALGHEFGGYSGVTQFGRAARAFRTLTDAAGVELT